MDYFDILLAKKLEDDRDPKVEGLSVSANGRYHEDGVVYDPVIVNVPETPLSKLTVTENGTYTAPSGTAYNEVEVDVPLPENAYLLKDIENTPTAIATFSDGANLPMPKLEVGIEPVQEGSGDPSPTNIRPISGWSSVNVVNMSEATNISYFQGLLNGTYGFVNCGGFSWEYVGNYGSATNVFKAYYFTKINTSATKYSAICDKYNVVSNDSLYLGVDKTLSIYKSSSDQYGVIRVNDTAYTDAQTFKQAMNGVYLIYELATPTTPTITAEQMNTLLTAFNINGQIYTIDLDGTRYGGKLDVVSGVLTVDRGMLTLNGSEEYYSIQSSSADDNTVLRVATGQVCKQNENQKSNYGTYNNNAWQPLASRVNTFVLGSEGNLYLQIPSSTASTVEEFKALFASNPLQVCYELTTPITIQLPTTVVKSLRGVNNVWGDCGDILDLSYLAKEE